MRTSLMNLLTLVTTLLSMISKFPKNCSDLFATCSYQDVRVFNTNTQQELLRINIPNMTCYCLDILADGTAIISGWDDSKIRAFYPETGRLMYSVHNAHKKGVTALCSTSTCNRIISGGGEGHVRIWDIKEIRPSGKPTGRGQHRRLDRKQAGDETGIPESTFVTVLVAAMHEHTNAVSCIQISKDDRSCVSASADSTCIVWCLETFRRRQIIFSNTLFRCICYHPTECQVITSGTDRKIGYWEVYDGSLIRQLDGSRSGSVNGMDITEDGKTFVTSGDDKIVKVSNVTWSKCLTAKYRTFFSFATKERTFRRRQIIFSNTLFRCICYHPTECQVITSGTDRKIGYWEVYDGSLIRQLDGSRSGSVNGMDITEDGKTFVTSGDDKIVKVWKYDEGEVTHVGLGHTSPVTRLRISPDQRRVITVSEDGAIYIWSMP
ncbi:hypothetical protein AHF37_01666 [Paragonimus kellicotti]|nr:hypothetical protein AHF37_01666 [Paragonimus kellicotti]